MITCNHDTPRPARTLSADELKLAYAFLLTMPGVPFIYYGDEIGMRYLDVKTKEGGYDRTGSRTPMQWDHSKNMGFTDGPEEDLYLPQDPAPDAPCVADQAEDPDSLYSETRRLTALRHAHEDLQADADFEVLRAEADAPFVYRRGDLILAINPSAEPAEWSSGWLEGRQVIYTIHGATIENGRLLLPPQSFAVAVLCP